MDIENRVVIVTGSGTGIGRAIAVEFGIHGANVVCCARRKNKIEETANIIQKKGGKAIAVPTDITKRAQVQNMVKIAREKFGPVDILFNNAGRFKSIAGVYEVDPENWWEDVKVNLYGSLLTIREVLPEMIERNEGIIINMNGGRPVGGSGYACGKAGLMELTRILAEELKLMKSSVMVFSAGPGLVRTEMTELQANTPEGIKWIPSTKELFEKGNVRKPEDIAKATIKLVKVAKPEASGKNYNPDTDFSRFNEVE